MDVCPMLWDICKGAPLSGNYHGVDHSSTIAGGKRFWVWGVGLGVGDLPEKAFLLHVCWQPEDIKP